MTTESGTRKPRRLSLGMHAKGAVKHVLTFLQGRLPQRSFDPLFEASFRTYRRAVRASFLLGSLLRLDWLKRDRWAEARAIHEVMPHSLVGAGGLRATYAAARRVLESDVPGDFVELGVAQGGSAALLGTVLFNFSDTQPRSLWLFDSFEGLPRPTAEDFRDAASGTGQHVRSLPEGSCYGGIEQVRALLLDQFGFPTSRTHFVQGWFQNTVPETRERIRRIAILRIDGDWYESTKVCLEGLYDLVSAGGFVIIDDYLSCYGCERAVDEFLADHSIEVAMHYDGRGGCYFLKP